MKSALLKKTSAITIALCLSYSGNANAGTISNNFDGEYSLSVGEDFILTETGSITNLDSIAIRLDSNTTASSINIQGDIYSTRYGLYLVGNNLGITGDINISGTIISNDGPFGEGSILIDGAEIGGEFINSGTIESTNTPAIFISRIFGDPATDIIGGINNTSTGIIRIYETGESGCRTMTSPCSAISIVGAQISGGITNTGIIEGDDSSNYAIYMTNLTAATPININGGRIIGSVYDENYNSGNNYSPVTIGGTFTQEGNFQVSSFTINSSGDFTFNDDYTLVIDQSSISNSGTMRVTSGDTITLMTEQYMWELELHFQLET